MLAINGGVPIWDKGWPKWPTANKNVVRRLTQVLESGRWAISGPFTGTKSQEKIFADMFAKYCNVKYCIPTCNGSSALLIALESLNIGVGDEVIIPVLTWVATATAVTNVNAIPVFVDVDPKTLCISPEKVCKAITKNTKAIIPVHLYSTMADMDALLKISNEYRIPIIEDCSHVHGAMWKGKRAGSLGIIGTFSMQQTKVLTAGEGGAAITDDYDLAKKMEALRADGRIYGGKTEKGKLELVPYNGLQGSNYCLSEILAAILIENLKILDKQHEIRLKNAKILDGMLRKIDGVYPIHADKRVNKRVFYKYVIRIDPECFAGRNAIAVANAISLELGINAEPIYKPLHKNSLFAPLSKKRFHINNIYISRFNSIRKMRFPVAEKAYSTYITFPHNILLGDYEHLQAIAEALEKVKQYADSIPYLVHHPDPPFAGAHFGAIAHA